MCKSKVLYDTIHANITWGSFTAGIYDKKLGKGNEWEGPTGQER